ncbi:hypothetical protein FNF28_07768 [Cafeteria roenbergensis]|uniref:Uncharacterized protein n=1 Tax=Cafeteria roenbergensis TaxID=33653 RepID=A0A5A8BYP8_CAFRO|nr:hypothetical protein FNF28_07768 [Cafeteria roenbergensis]
MQATADDHVEVVQLLLDRGADVEATGVGGETALMQAAEWGNADIYGVVALMQATADDHVEVVQLLLDRGADVEAKSRVRPLWHLP